MDRRTFLGAAAAGVLAVRSREAPAAGEPPRFAPEAGRWRRFEIVTSLAMQPSAAPLKAWVPLPAVSEVGWMRPAGNSWTTNAAQTAFWRDPSTGTELLQLEWAPGTVPAAEIRSRVDAADRAVNLARPADMAPLDPAERARLTAPTTLLPTDGIVRETARRIVGSARTDLRRARLLYEWIVENTFRDPNTRGCGLGDIASMLESGNLGGKCADLNALFVGMARSLGLPARDVYGLRVGPSRFGYRSLGANAAVVTKAQHCRAEVHLAGFGWVPVDPADVRKVALEEPPGNRPLADPLVAGARRTLFGAWEGNWLAYNTAHDLALPGSREPAIEFLMYPQAETAAGRLDPLDPDSFGYRITATELAI